MSNDVFERMNELEWERHDRLSSAVSFQAGLALAIAGGLAFVVKKPPLLTLGIPVVVFGLSVALSVLGLLLQVWFLIRAWHDYIYAYLPAPDTIQETLDGLKAYYLAKGGPAEQAAKRAEAEFQHQLREVHRRIAQHNRLNNNFRSGCLHKARMAFVASLACLFLTTVTFMTLPSREESPTKVIAQDPIKVKLMSDQQPTEPLQKPASKPDTDKPAQPPKEAPKPPPLEPEFIREGDTGKGKPGAVGGNR